jgi:predicted AlkP superfamily phosphohydrolase/phosphomutase
VSEPRTLIIGLDGATFDLITPWVQAGYLPALARLIEQGVHGPLLAWPNMNSAASWTSMVTGCNPGRHGVYGFGTTAPQRGVTWRPTTAATRAEPPFWSLLSAAGDQVGVVNVPISYPVDPVNGFMLAGMDAPSVESPGFAHPPELLAELRRAGIAYTLDVAKLEGPRRRAPREVPELVRRMVDARAAAILHLMRTRPWDVLMAVFVVTDRMQHFFWPRGDAPPDSDDWAAVRGVYQQIDAFLEQALGLLDEPANVLLVSDHGFGPSCFATRSVNQIFEQLGWVGRHRRGGTVTGRLLRNALRHGRRLIPLALQPHLARAFPKIHFRSLSESTYAGIDWSTTRAFVHPYGGEVFVNLRGREPEGIVAPEEYEALRARIYEVLTNLTDAVTGRRLVRAVGRREELYHGAFAAGAADLRIRWDYDAVGDSLCYRDGETLVTVRVPTRQDARVQWSGSHRPEGILIASGPSFRSGATISDARVYDIAPTVMHLRGRPVPAGLDGRVLSEAITAESLHRQPVRYGAPAAGAPAGARTELDAQEAREVEQRLRDLGYIE